MKTKIVSARSDARAVTFARGRAEQPQGETPSVSSVLSQSAGKRSLSVLRAYSLVALTLFLLGGSLRAAPTDPWTHGTGLFGSITLGALKDTSVVNRQWPAVVNYDFSLSTWPYDIYVPPGYDATKPFGVVAYITSDDNTGGVVLQTASSDKNIIWIAPRNVGNQANSPDRYGAALMAIYRAKELFNIDPRRVYVSGKSGGAQTANALAFYHSEVIHGAAPASGFNLPRLNAVTPDYIPNTSTNTDSYFNYSNQTFNYYYVFAPATHRAIEQAGRTNKLRSYIITRYDDHREDYFVEGFHCAFEPQGQICFLYDGPGGHTDPSDAEMKEAIDYLDRDDIFPVNANITAGAGGFSGMTDISQSGASAVEATSGNNTTYTLTPTLTATAASKTTSPFYWDNANGSTVRWLWEVKNATPTNQKTSFGLWFANETWGGGAPTSVTAGSNPGILITITQNGTQNRMIVSARPDTGGETVFYDGLFSFVPAYSTAWTSTQTGYLTGTGSPVEIRMDLNKSRWQLTFNGIKLDGTTNSIASGTQISRDNKRMLFGYWDSATGGSPFWTHGAVYSTYNTWSPFTKSIFTAATGALSGAGATPSPVELRYVIASDPNLPNPPSAAPTGLAATVNGGAIDLSWNALAGATSYEVKRATASGGPYTTLQSGYAGTSYSDTSPVSGTLYYYTVSANTASGATLNATEAVAGINLPALTWIGAGADNNWQTAANWTTMPVAGDTLNFAGGRLTATNNFAVDTSFGGLVFPSGSSAFTLGGNSITLTGGVTNGGSNAQTINLAMAIPSGSHSVTTNASGDVALAGVLSGGGGLVKAGAGTATLSAINTYTGNTTVNAGTLALGAGGGSGAVRGTVTVNSGATLKAMAADALGYNNDGTRLSQLNITGGTFDDGVNANQGYRTNVTLTGGTMSSTGGGGFNFTAGFGIASAASAATSTISGGITLRDNANMTIDVADGAAATDLLISGVIGGGGGAITKTGTGTLGLTGSNSFTAGFTANAGTIIVGNANALGTGTATLNGVTLNNTGSSLTVGNAIAIGTNGATIALGSGAGNLSLSGAISGSGNLTVAPAGGPLNSIYLSFSSNTLTGTITIANSSGNNQTVTRIGSANAGSATAAWVIGGAQDRGTSLEFGTGTISFGSLSGSGLIVGGSGTQTMSVGALGGSTTFSGKIQNGIALTKIGAGMLTLSGTNSYTGPTAINAGALNITGALSGASAVTVNNGGTLAGTGSVAGATTVAGGGAISPGNGGAGAAGTLTLSGGLALGNGAVLSLDLAGTTTSDKIAVSGTFSATGTTTISLAALGGFAGSGTYPLITGASGIGAGNFAVGATPSGYVGTLGASGGTLNLTMMTVQENWRLTYFGTTANSGNAADGADPDGDGLTNAQEFAAGTAPNDQASVLRASIAINENDLVVSFPSVAGKTYRVERSDTLASDSWTTQSDNIPGTGGVLQVTDIGAASQAKRFYRIVLIP